VTALLSAEPALDKGDGDIEAAVAGEILLSGVGGLSKGRGTLARQKPPEAYRDVIRVQGLLAHRPPGQRSWSRALVHGVDPRVGAGGGGG
jgi:hypothetical protein